MAIANSEVESSSEGFWTTAALSADESRSDSDTTDTFTTSIYGTHFTVNTAHSDWLDLMTWT